MSTIGLRPVNRASAFWAIILLTMVSTACGQQDPAFKEDRSTQNRDSGDLKSGGAGGEIEPGMADTELDDADGGMGDSDHGGTDGIDAGAGGGDAGGIDSGSDGYPVSDGSGGGNGSDAGNDSGTDGMGSDGGGNDGGLDDGGYDSGSENPPGNVTRRTVNAVQGGPGKVDILWVVDSSGSMSEEQAYLGNNFQSFINQLVAAGHDFQTAVTSTDVCHSTIPGPLSERVCPVDYGGSAETRLRGSFVGSTGRKVLKHSDSDIVSRFTSYTKVGTKGSGFEHGLTAAKLAIEKVQSGQNEPLIRSDAFLAVIVVSDEEDDGIGLSMVDPAHGRNFTAEGLTTYRFTDDDMINHLKSVKGEGKFSVSAIVPTRNANGQLCSASHSKPDEEGTQYIKAAQKSGGIVQSICATNWSSSLAQIGYDLNAQLTQIVLPSIPDVATIKVFVNNVQISSWTYNQGNNAVKFNSGSVPAEGAQIRVEYIEAR